MEASLERLPQTVMDKLCSADDYPGDSYVFSYCGYDLPIRSQQVADTFAGLPEQEQSILISHLALDLTDRTRRLLTAAGDEGGDLTGKGNDDATRDGQHAVGPLGGVVALERQAQLEDADAQQDQADGTDQRKDKL